MKGKVQCFYNANYNYGAYDGQSKFVWGFSWFYLLDSSEPLTEQILKAAKLEKSDVFNLNLTAFTPFTNETLEGK